MSTLYLIRHGKTRANVEHLYCGSTDLPLSPEGRRELQTLHYSAEGVRFLTSGMRRTEETLELLFGPVPHQTDPRFREVDFGDFEMKSYEMLKEVPAYQQWLTGDNEKNVPPNGESGEQMGIRVREGLQALLAQGQDTVLVTHGGVIALLMAELFPKEQKNRYQWQPSPGHGYVIRDGGYQAIPDCK